MNRPIPAAILEVRGWTVAAVGRLELDYNGSRVVIPVRDATGELVGATRYLPGAGNGAVKMLADSGTTRELFPPPETIAEDEARGVVWLVEGEPDAQNWRKEWAARFHGRGWTVLVCFDIDEPGRTKAARAVSDLVELGIDARCVDLEPRATHKGFDLTDLLAGHSPVDSRALLDTLADEAPFVEASAPSSDELAVRFITAEQFVAHPVPQAEPIVVDAGGSTMFPATRFELIYGNGGAGKTTLWLDAAMHFAAGEPWLDGLAVPTRPLRIGWIENEGPQEEFRRKLERKLEAWHGRFPEGHARVLDRPWGSFDLRLEQHRDELARAITEHDLDLLIVGPLYRLGMEGGGTPDDVGKFVELLEDVQRRAGRPVSIAVLHHENRAGQVSGAWEGRPDLLVHVQARGHGHTRVCWQEAKWSSPLHGTTSALVWGEGEGFELEEAGPARPERVWDAIAEYVLAHGGCSWNAVEQHVAGTADYLRTRRTAMLEEGVLVNAGKPKAFELWHVDDPARPVEFEDVRRETDALADAPASTTGGAGLSVGASMRRLVRDDAPTDDAPPGASEEASAT